MAVAVLIDAENQNHLIYERVREESLKRGRVVITRVFGDFQRSAMQGWLRTCKSAILEQRSRISEGKNASDIHLCIDAMELLLIRPNVSVSSN